MGAKDTTKPKTWRRKDLLLAASKEKGRGTGEGGYFPKQYLPRWQNWGRFKLKVMCVFVKGLEQR